MDSSQSDSANTGTGHSEYFEFILAREARIHRNYVLLVLACIAIGLFCSFTRLGAGVGAGVGLFLVIMHWAMDETPPP